MAGKTQSNPTFTTKQRTVILDEKENIVGEVVHKGKHARLARYNGGAQFIEDNDGNTIFAINDSELDTADFVETVKFVDRRIDAKRKTAKSPDESPEIAETLPTEAAA